MFAASKTAAAASGAPPAATDPQFNYVTMLLHGDGTNGAQNNTFVDSSTNNFTITRNGTPTQGSFSPYGTLWSNQFSGTQYFVLGGQSAFSFDADFTIEMWFNAAGAGTGTPKLYESRGNGQEGVYVTIEHSGTSLVFRMSSAARITTTFSYNTWNHVALVRSSGVITMYLNGVSAGTYSTSATTLVGTSRPCIGAYPGFDNFNGYISNLRVVKGTALYTSAFTPPTTPLTAVSGTSLLTCQSNRFRDNSSNNFAITVTGTPSVQRFSPFDPAAEYSTSVIGGSGFFNGTSDFLTFPTSTAFDQSGDFTIESWIYLTAAPASGTTIGGAIYSQESAATRLLKLSVYNNLKVAVTQAGVGQVFTSTQTLSLFTWYHVALVKNGSGTGNIKLYINGVNDGSGTKTDPGASTTTSYIGREAYTATGTIYFPGYMSNWRFVKGTAVYTAAFTPPTAPLTAVTNTSLLLNTVNAGIFDNAMMNDLVTVGNAQVSTAVKKYGTGSMYFDGTGDWIAAPDNAWSSFGTGDFTIEGWVWLDSTVNPGRPDNLKTVTVFSTGSSSANDCSFAIYGSTSVAGVGLELYQASPAIAISAASTVPTNSWAHIAFVRSGTTIYGFVNGVRSTLGTTSSAIGSGVAPKVGAANTTGYSNQFKGYIDDLRITKGYARYTANFTPPTAPFPNN